MLRASNARIFPSLWSTLQTLREICFYLATTDKPKKNSNEYPPCPAQRGIKQILNQGEFERWPRSPKLFLWTWSVLHSPGNARLTLVKTPRGLPSASPGPAPKTKRKKNQTERERKRERERTKKRGKTWADGKKGLTNESSHKVKKGTFTHLNEIQKLTPFCCRNPRKFFVFDFTKTEIKVEFWPQNKHKTNEKNTA